MITDSALTFDSLGHSYSYRGSPVPHVTAILRDMRVTPPYPPDCGWLAFGQAVHLACERFLRGTLPFDPRYKPGDLRRWPDTSEALHSRLEAFAQKVSEYQIEPISTEIRLYHPSLGYAGTADLWCRVLGHESIIDYKTGSTPESAALQTAAYDLALASQLREPRPLRRRFALELFADEVKQTGKARMREFTDRLDYQYWEGILWAWKYFNRRKGAMSA